MEKFIIRYVLCGVLLWLGLSVAMFGKNLTSSACPLKSFEGDLINHPYPLDNKCVMLKHFGNLKRVLYADFAKHPEKGVSLLNKIQTINAKIDSINAAPFAFVRVHELALASRTNSACLNPKSAYISPVQKSYLKIAMCVSFLVSLACLIWLLKDKNNSNGKLSYILGIVFCSFLVFSIIFGSFAF